MLAYYRASLLLMFLLLMAPDSPLAQRCERPTFEITEDLLSSAFNDSENVVLKNFSLACLSVSPIKDHYRTATAMVGFVFTGPQPTFLNGQCTANTQCNALFTGFECDPNTDTWITNSSGLPLTVLQGNLSRSFNDSPRIDCGSCGDAIIDVDKFNGMDPLTGCLSCHPACRRQDGLSYCTGLTEFDCCRYFELGKCVKECSERRAPNDEKDCVCQENLFEPNCTACDLMCVNGAPDSECSVCVCEAGFTGDDCSVNIDDCANVTCVNGECIDMINGSICNCPPNYSGAFCEVCDVQNCKDCSLTQFNVCDMCVDGFMLTDNGTCIDPCSRFTCLNNGTCVSSGGVAICQCQDGFEGSNCEMDFDECAEGPCVSSNTVVCIDERNSFTCQCRSGFTGELCEVNIDDCDSNSCHNGGTCVDGIDSFSCDCPSNFQGTTCEVCTIVNCAECSLQEEVCAACNFNYKLDYRMKDCVIDSKSICSYETLPVQCQFDYENQQYNIVASGCGINTTHPPNIDENASPETRFQTNLEYYRTQYNKWFTRYQLGTRRPTTSEETRVESPLDHWRNECRNWEDTIYQWIENSEMMNMPSLPALDCDGDPEEVYHELLVYYSNIIQQFQELRIHNM